MLSAARSSLVPLLFLFAVSAGFARGQSLDSRVPVRTVRGYLMVVKASVNGHPPVDFLVDTGSNSTLIDPQLAKELDLKPIGQIILNSLAGSTPVSRYHLQSLRLGDAAVSGLEALALPLTQLQALDHRIRGIVGLNFLLQFSFLLDYEQQRFEVFPFPDQVQSPPGIRVAAQIHDGRILVPVTSNASPQKTWRLSLDSAIAQTLVFASRMDTSTTKVDRCRASGCITNVSTNLARHEAQELRLREMHIGDIQLSDVALVVLRNESLDPRDPADGVLPASLFDFIFFDRTNATLVFKPGMPALARR